MKPSTPFEQRGLTATEILVVVAIIAAVMAIAVPHLLAARVAAQEGRAIANLRTLATAEITLFASRRHFGSFEQLFAGDYLRPGQFERGSAEGGPQGSSAEAVTDGVYLYTTRFSLDAQGVTLDADPVEANTATHRRFRFRLGRRTRGGAWANEGLLLVAPPSVASPPGSAYQPLNS